MYQRKTKDEYEIQQYTGDQYKWEVVCCEETLKDARECRKEYRNSQPEYPVRIVKKRIKHVPETQTTGTP